MSNAGIGGQTERCLICGMKCYVYEMVRSGVKNQVYHKKCFKCTSCGRQLQIFDFAQAGNKVYCTQHYKEIFGRKKNYDNIEEERLNGQQVPLEKRPVPKKPNPNASRFGVSAPKCPKCSKSCYQADSTKTGVRGMWFHNVCFKCTVCKNGLTNATGFAIDDTTPYCPEHYTKVVAQKKQYHDPPTV